ncbi:MAG: DUF1566 domain-containing protein [Rikenellaceae bacterium]
MKELKILTTGLFALATLSSAAQNYKIVDTEQSKCFDDTQEIKAPKKNAAFYGQDAQHQGNAASYTDNGDGTVTDNVTGLVWQKSYEVMSYKEALIAAEKFKLAGHSDWRIPTIKEAYSLILFSGSDVNPQLSGDGDQPGNPFINASFFDFKYAANGNRPIDSQMLSSTLYVGSTETENLIFGVNFADGRIKGYGMGFGGGDKEFVVRFVRGADYGQNDFVDNGDGTINDNATTLMWSKSDSQEAMNWQEALAYAQKMNKENYLGHSDWRVPNAKELQSLVDYSRSPLSSSSASIDPMFECTLITDEAGVGDYAFYWTSTTHENSGTSTGGAGVYVAFGRSLGNMSNSQGMGMMPGQGQGQGQGARGGEGGERPQMREGEGTQRPPMREGEGEGQHGQGMGNRSQSSGEPNWVDIHGAGSQRSDPKSGDASVYATGHGPQGDAIRINNYVRLVRDL